MRESRYYIVKFAISVFNMSNHLILSGIHKPTKISPLTRAIQLALTCFATQAAFAADSDNHSVNTLQTITLQAEGNWLENANAEKVQKHAGARTIIDRKR